MSELPSFLRSSRILDDNLPQQLFDVLFFNLVTLQKILIKSQPPIECRLFVEQYNQNFFYDHLKHKTGMETY